MKRSRARRRDGGRRGWAAVPVEIGGSEIEAGLAVFPHRRHRMDVALAEDEVLLAPDLHLEARVGREQHLITLLQVPDRGSDRHHLGPGEPPVEVGGGGDEDAAAALAVAGVVGRQHEHPVGGHADRLLGVVVALRGARGHDPRIPGGVVSAPDGTGFRGPQDGAARFARVAESSEVAGRHAPLVTQAPPSSSHAESWTRRAGTTVLAYFHLTKPRVIELLLVTTLPAMILAAGEMPPLSLILQVLIGGTLAAGGANTINCWIERDRDQMMRRTAHRPLPHGDVKPEGALVFGLVLEALAFALLWSTVNLLSATLAVSAMLFYVFVYTIWLKPRSPHNIVIGGAAGAVPVLVGWAAVTGEVAAPAWILFAIVFFWTPPHFWALSLKYFDDYRAAGIPMLPVAKGIPTAVRQIVVYSFIVVAITFTLPLTTDAVGAVYLVTAAVLGALFIGQAIRLARDTTPAQAIRLFTFSNTYLALLFAAVAVDTLLRSA